MKLKQIIALLSGKKNEDEKHNQRVRNIYKKLKCKT